MMPVVGRGSLNDASGVAGELECACGVEGSKKMPVVRVGELE